MSESGPGGGAAFSVALAGAARGIVQTRPARRERWLDSAARARAVVVLRPCDLLHPGSSAARARACGRARGLAKACRAPRRAARIGAATREAAVSRWPAIRRGKHAAARTTAAVRRDARSPTNPATRARARPRAAADRAPRRAANTAHDGGRPPRLPRRRGGGGAHADGLGLAVASAAAGAARCASPSSTVASGPAASRQGIPPTIAAARTADQLSPPRPRNAVRPSARAASSSSNRPSGGWRTFACRRRRSRCRSHRRRAVRRVAEDTGSHRGAWRAPRSVAAPTAHRRRARPSAGHGGAWMPPAASARRIPLGARAQARLRQRARYAAARARAADARVARRGDRRHAGRRRRLVG